MDFEEMKSKLISLGYEVSVFSSGKEAVEYLKEEIKGKTVGFGGSMTLEQLGMYDALSMDNEVYWHWRLPEGVSSEEMNKKEQTCQIFMCSVNGMSKNGEIINIDGTCNRISGELYGHEKVYFVVGRNKIAENFDEALYRARNVAAPLNAKRLNKKTPCVMDLKCHDCKAPERICNGLTVLWHKPSSGPYEIVLIDEDLGY